jgi:hypothetical protein
VLLVFQNALAFNSDTTVIAQSSVKLATIFERLFYEYVLNLEYDPLDKPEACHACRSILEDDDDENIVLCDRCDGCYHIDCLFPSIQLNSRTDWFCPACIEERDINLIHPLRSFRCSNFMKDIRNAIVMNPNQSSKDETFGRIVGIAKREGKPVHCVYSDETVDIQYYLEYHIEFGYSPEDLSEMDAVKTVGNGNEKTAVWRLDEVLRYRHS